MIISTIDIIKNSSSTTVIDSIIDLIAITSSYRYIAAYKSKNRTRDGGWRTIRPRYRVVAARGRPPPPVEPRP